MKNKLLLSGIIPILSITFFMITGGIIMNKPFDILIEVVIPSVCLGSWVVGVINLNASGETNGN